MPVYSYRCKTCDHTFDKQSLMEDRKQPESDGCPECGQQSVYQRITSTTIGYSIAPNLRTSDNFNSRLKEIRKKSGSGNTIGESIR